MAITIDIDTARPYQVHVGTFLLEQAGPLVRATAGGAKAVIVTDTNVGPLYQMPVKQSLEASGYEVSICTFEAGEAHKRAETYVAILEFVAEHELSRSDVIVALGGGVVGDVAGFVAATYMRGVDFINCPTTTLSQIDSSIGGKVAVDLGRTKNIVGAFWQPKLVVVDPDTLATLPRRHFVNGLAESVKMSLTCDAELFQMFETCDVDAELETIIRRSLLIKKSVVERDETEQGLRAILNFGHTLGHGIEAVKGIGGRRKTGLYHGECVALGMLPMIEDRQLQKRTRAVLRKLGLPCRASYNKEKVLSYMLHDKKARGDSITLVKVPGLGCWR
mgnify:CR=1 FL=1